MLEWVIIYHDGQKMSIVKSTEKFWNDAPKDGVQVCLFKQGNKWQSVSGVDEYNFESPGAETKIGKLITDEQWKEVRNYMVNGKWRT